MSASCQHILFVCLFDLFLCLFFSFFAFSFVVCFFFFLPCFLVSLFVDFVFLSFSLFLSFPFLSSFVDSPPISVSVAALPCECAVLWRVMISRHGGLVTSGLDISSLAKVSDGYTAGMIANVCSSVLIERRVNQLVKRPLAGIEFIAPLARLDPIYKEEEEMFKVCASFKPNLHYSVFCRLRLAI